MIVKEIEWRDPLAAFAPFAREPQAVLLHAGDAAEGARWSIMAVRPSMTIERRDGVTYVGGAVSPLSPIEALGVAHGSRRRALTDDAPPFLSGLVGFAGYECGALLEPTAPGPTASGTASDFLFGAFDSAISFDRRARRAFVSAPDWSAAEAFEEALGVAPPPTEIPPLHFAGSNFSAARYRDAVREVIRRIMDGAIYQANISHRLLFKSDEEIDALSIFARALARSSAPFGAYLNTGATRIVSLSPERFFSVTQEDRASVICAEPIKGTRPRGATPQEDEALACALLNSAKDRAENVMIADLTRNDLSRVCADGSIREEAIAALQSHATVHHLVSRISGQLMGGLTAADALAALFPCGSITGAPKVEAMRTIAAVEGAARGPYCGAIGYIDDRGGADFSVAIRTALASGRCVELPVGGGVTLRSDPEAEYQETLDKAAWFLRLAGIDRATLA
jgi:para-aminobenzoate synthetase component 1